MLKKSFLIILSIFVCLIIYFVGSLVYISYFKKQPETINVQLQPPLKGMPQSRPILLVLFSPTCGPCQILISRIHEKRDSLKLTNVILGSTRDSITTSSFFKDISPDFAKDFKSFKMVYDARKNLSSYFSGLGTPKVYIFDKNEHLKMQHSGPIHIDSVLAALKPLF